MRSTGRVIHLLGDLFGAMTEMYRFDSDARSRVRTEVDPHMTGEKYRYFLCLSVKRL